MEHIAHHDALTQLPNRRMLWSKLRELQSNDAARAGVSALLYIDLDSLKYINDTFGHSAGDASILQFSRILTETFRESDVVGRLGGDEFVIMMVDATESDLASIQARMQSNVDAYNLQAASGQSLSFSLGVIRVEPESTVTMEELLSQADAAMYKHKLSRKRTKA